MRENNPGTFQSAKAWGYSIAAGCLLIAFISLILALKPVFLAARDRVKAVTLPGVTRLDVATPGAYMGIFVLQEKNELSLDSDRIHELEYTLSDEKTESILQINKMPHRGASDDQKQVPLFNFFIEKPGAYLLRSNYPYEMDGPTFQAFVVHMDLRYVQAELIVGVIVFLIFTVLAVWVFRKTRKQFAQ